MSELLYKIDMMTIKTMEAFADDLLPMADEFKDIPKDHFIVLKKYAEFTVGQMGDSAVQMTLNSFCRSYIDDAISVKIGGGMFMVFLGN